MNLLQHDLTQELQACHSKSRRNGKVARLPAELRDQINRMLDDGVPYKTIIEKLGEAGKHLNEDNISNWRFGGFKDYLHARAINDRAQVRTDAAAELLRENSNADPALLRKVCQEIALVDYMTVLLDQGEQIARDSLTKNPAKFITLLNSICKVSSTGLALEKRADRLAAQFPVPNPSEPNRTQKK